MLIFTRRTRQKFQGTLGRLPRSKLCSSDSKTNDQGNELCLSPQTCSDTIPNEGEFWKRRAFRQKLGPRTIPTAPALLSLRNAKVKGTMAS